MVHSRVKPAWLLDAEHHGDQSDVIASSNSEEFFVGKLPKPRFELQIGENHRLERLSSVPVHSLE